MIRSVIGMAIVVVSFAFKATLNHNLEYWSTVKEWTFYFSVIGCIIIGSPIFEWIDQAKPKTFRSDPPGWILYVFKSIIVLTLITTIAVQLENFGVWTKKKLANYYLNKETSITDGLITEEREVSYTIKRTGHERFYIVRYNASGEIMEQGLQPDSSLIIGQTYKAIYSQKYPSILSIKRRHKTAIYNTY